MSQVRHIPGPSVTFHPRLGGESSTPSGWRKAATWAYAVIVVAGAWVVWRMRVGGA